MKKKELIEKVKFAMRSYKRGSNISFRAKEIISLCQPQWIKRSERNPKVRGSYLTYKEGIDEIQFNNFGTSSGWENGRNLGVDNIYRVTHWQEKPGPPEADK